MNTSVTDSARPARSYATGPITRGLRLLSALAALAITTWIIVRYPSLPQTVPTHFDVSGQADDWGPRWSVLVLAAVMLLLSLGLAVLSTHPRAFNYPLEITARTAQAVYREGERMMVAALVGVQLIYLDIALSVIGGPGAGVLIWIGMTVLVGSVVIGIVRLVRAGR